MGWIIAQAVRDGGSAVGAILAQIALDEDARDRRDVDLLAGKCHWIGVAFAGQFDEIYILLFQAGGLQDPQHQRALCLTGAEIRLPRKSASVLTSTPGAMPS